MLEILRSSVVQRARRGAREERVRVAWQVLLLLTLHFQRPKHMYEEQEPRRVTETQLERFHGLLAV
jgi:hypothetical protein